MSLKPIKPTTAETDQLGDLIAAKLQVLEILVRLSRQQMGLIDASNMNLLIKLLAAKQTVMQQLQMLERQLAPFRDQDPDRRVWQSAQKRRDCQALAERCNALLTEAMELERQMEAAMLRRQEATAAALTGVQASADARWAYSAAPAPPATSLQVEG
jgi:flagellar biosynthesis/type III secretory pathway chaperone